VTGLDEERRHTMPASAELRLQLNLEQAFMDGIRYRMAQLKRPCGECAPGRRCDEHELDSHLIKGYRRRLRALYSAETGKLEAALLATLPPSRPLGEFVSIPAAPAPN
jgi:hypothetical protein